MDKKMKSPLNISCDYYYWKPYMAYFSAFELNAYEIAGWHPSGDVLDLGCNDGTFATMLKELIGFRAHLTGIDIHPNLVSQAAKTGIYEGIANADATYLPFMAESFNHVISNSVLYCLRPNPLTAMQEVTRILKPGGYFIFTVPTDIADQHYYIYDRMKTLGYNGIANWYRNKVNKRLKNVSSFSPTEWANLVRQSGLCLDRIIPYINSQISKTWSMYLEIPRILSLMKVLPLKSIHRTSARVQEALMKSSYLKYTCNQFREPGDYVLIIAQKPSPNL